MDWKNRDILWIYLFGVGMLALTGYLYWDQFTPEWKGYQSEFHDLVAKKFGEQRAETIPSGIQQVWVKEINRTDRCTTCHQGIEWKGFESAPNPYRTHPREVLEKHPVSQVWLYHLPRRTGLRDHGRRSSCHRCGKLGATASWP